MSTFHDLIRGHLIEKSQDTDRYYTPREAIKQFNQPLTRPGAQIVLDALKRRQEQHGKPGYRGVELLDRPTTFTDVVLGSARGFDVRRRGIYDEWQERLGDEEIADLLDALDEEGAAKSFDEPQVGDVILKSGVNLSAIVRRGLRQAGL